MNINGMIIKTIIGSIFLIILASCQTGYRVDLDTMNQHNISSAVKDILTKEGYIYDEAKLIKRDDSSIWVERFFREREPMINKSKDYYIHVDLIYQEQEDTQLHVKIYNVYKGNNPEFITLMTEMADKIEKDIRNRVPGITIQRSAGTFGLLF